MSNKVILQRQRERFKVLKKIYDESGGNPGPFVEWRGMGKEFGLDDQKLLDIIRYLKEEGLVDPVTSNHVIITNLGVNEVESILTKPDKPTEHFAPNIIFVGEMKNSAIQQGTINSKQSVTIIQQSELPQINEVVKKIENALTQIEIERDVKNNLESDIDTIKAQTKSSKPKRNIVLESFKSIKNILVTIPAIISSNPELIEAIKEIIQILVVV